MEVVICWQQLHLADKFFSDQKLLVYLIGKKNTHGRIINQQVTEVYLLQGLLFLLMKDQHQPVRFFAGACRIGTGVLLWAGEHLVKDWFRMDFILLMVQ